MASVTAFVGEHGCQIVSASAQRYPFGDTQTPDCTTIDGGSLIVVNLLGLAFIGARAVTRWVTNGFSPPLLAHEVLACGYASAW
jgi:hypothetical protein